MARVPSPGRAATGAQSGRPWTPPTSGSRQTVVAPLGGAVVSEDYGPRGNEFTSEINWVQIDLDEAAEDLDHLITPEERLSIAMLRQ